MKTVFLLRHAKSSWDEPHLEDFRRPLAPRGRKAAPRIGRFMARNHLVPDRVLCSAAQRAAETWELVSGAFDAHIPVEYLEEIYHATPGMLLTLIHGLPAGEVSVLLVGHNPTFETLALQLAGEGNAEALETMAAKYPTGGLAIIDFHGSEWWNVKPGEGTLRDFIRPKALK